MSLSVDLKVTHSTCGWRLVYVCSYVFVCACTNVMFRAKYSAFRPDCWNLFDQTDKGLPTHGGGGGGAIHFKHKSWIFFHPWFLMVHLICCGLFSGLTSYLSVNMYYHFMSAFMLWVTVSFNVFFVGPFHWIHLSGNMSKNSKSTCSPWQVKWSVWWTTVQISSSWILLIH